MGFWLATLNPGKKTRRGRRKRRTLTAWQRAVKRHGGVMQAVKARRAGKRKRKGGRRRRNPFLTTALTSGGAKVLMNSATRRRRRKLRTRRSAVARTSVRRRSRRASPLRRSKMARKTRRRRLSRGRGGRFVSRRSRGGTRRRRSRRTRRNPVLPISWNPRRKRRGSRRRRSRRNPLFLSRKGFSSRKHRGYRRLRIRRRAPRTWHNNPRRRRYSRRRSYRNNPVLPISWNPARALGIGGAPGQILGKLGSFVDVKFWTEVGVPAAGGFFGSKAVGTLIIETATKMGLPIPAVAQPYAKMAADALGGATLAWAVSKFYSSKAGDSIWLGTVVNVAHSLLKQLLGGTAIAKTIGLDGLGDDLAQRMKDEIARRVQNNLNGMGSYLRSTNLPRNGMGEYVTLPALRTRPSFAPTPGADLKDYDVTNQENSF